MCLAGCGGCPPPAFWLPPVLPARPLSRPCGSARGVAVRAGGGYRVCARVAVGGGVFVLGFSLSLRFVRLFLGGVASLPRPLFVAFLLRFCYVFVKLVHDIVSWYLFFNCFGLS